MKPDSSPRKKEAKELPPLNPDAVLRRMLNTPPQPRKKKDKEENPRSDFPPLSPQTGAGVSPYPPAFFCTPSHEKGGRGDLK